MIKVYVCYVDGVLIGVYKNREKAYNAMIADIKANPYLLEANTTELCITNLTKSYKETEDDGFTDDGDCMAEVSYLYD